MQQPFTENHYVDDNLNPAGGDTKAVGLDIRWQDGPLAVDGERKAPNGAFAETVIAAALGRIRFYQSGKFACRENALAITKLEEAIFWLEHRTRDREARGVEGTHTP